jgi:hypothetical protein
MKTVSKKKLVDLNQEEKDAVCKKHWPRHEECPLTAMWGKECGWFVYQQIKNKEVVQ